MAYTAKTYASFFANAVQGNIKWNASGDTFKVALLSASENNQVSLQSHSTYADISGSEIAASGGYTTGGATITVSNPVVYSGTTTSGTTWPSVWSPAVSYPVGSIVIPTSAGNNYLYQAVAISGSGTSGAVAPPWPTVSGEQVIDNSGSNQIIWTCQGQSVTLLNGTNAEWLSSTLTALCAVLYDSTSGSLVSFLDFGGSVSSSSGTFQIAVPTIGGTAITAWVAYFQD